MTRISWDDFLTACDNFLVLSQNEDEGWTMMGNRSEEGQAFLSRSLIRKLSKDEIQKLHNDEDLGKGIRQLYSTPDSESIVISCRYDIVYNISYAVPVIFFNVSRPNGQLFSIREMWSLVSPTVKSEDMWSTLSQQDHSVLSLPFFTLHPCNTEKILLSLSAKPRLSPLAYLISWLSIIGSLLGFSMSLSHAKALTLSTE